MISNDIALFCRADVQLFATAINGCQQLKWLIAILKPNEVYWTCLFCRTSWEVLAERQPVNEKRLSGKPKKRSTFKLTSECKEKAGN